MGVTSTFDHRAPGFSDRVHLAHQAFPLCFEPLVHFGFIGINGAGLADATFGLQLPQLVFPALVRQAIPARRPGVVPAPGW